MVNLYNARSNLLLDKVQHDVVVDDLPLAKRALRCDILFEVESVEVRHKCMTRKLKAVLDGLLIDMNHTTTARLFYGENTQGTSL